MSSARTLEAIAAMPVVTKQNLGVLLGVSPATLDYRVQRLQATGELLRLRSGLYAPTALWQAAQSSPEQTQQNLEYLSGIVHSPSCLLLEYVLEKAGIIPRIAVYPDLHHDQDSSHLRDAPREICLPEHSEQFVHRIWS